MGETDKLKQILLRQNVVSDLLNDKADNGNGDGDGEAGEVIDFLADDNTVGLDLMLDARRFLLDRPRRLVQIAYKRYSGIPLDTKEQESLRRHRQKELQRYQKTLF